MFRFDLCQCCGSGSGGIYDFYNPPSVGYVLYYLVDNQYPAFGSPGQPNIQPNLTSFITATEDISYFPLFNYYSSYPNFSYANGVNTSFARRLSSVSDNYWRIPMNSGEEINKLEVDYNGPSPFCIKQFNTSQEYVWNIGENTYWKWNNPITGNTLSGWTTGPDCYISGDHIVFTGSSPSSGCYVEWNNTNLYEVLQAFNITIDNDYSQAIQLYIQTDDLYGGASENPSGYTLWLYTDASASGKGSSYRYFDNTGAITRGAGVGDGFSSYYPYSNLLYYSGNELVNYNFSTDVEDNIHTTYKIRLTLVDDNITSTRYLTGSTGLTQSSGFSCHIPELYIATLPSGGLDSFNNSLPIINTTFDKSFSIKLFDVENQRATQSFYLPSLDLNIDNDYYYSGNWRGDNLFFETYMSGSEIWKLLWLGTDGTHTSGSFTDYISAISIGFNRYPFTHTSRTIKINEFFTSIYNDDNFSHCPTYTTCTNNTGELAICVFNVNNGDDWYIDDFSGENILPGNYGNFREVFDFIGIYDQTGGKRLLFGLRDIGSIWQTGQQDFSSLDPGFGDRDYSNTQKRLPSINLMSQRDYPNCFAVQPPTVEYVYDTVRSTGLANHTVLLTYGPVTQESKLVRYDSTYVNHNFSGLNTGDAGGGTLYTDVHVPYLYANPDLIIWSGSNEQTRTLGWSSVPISNVGYHYYGPSANTNFNINANILYGDYIDNTVGVIFRHYNRQYDTAGTLTGIHDYIKIKIGDNIVWDYQVSGLDTNNSDYPYLPDLSTGILPVRGLSAVFPNSNSVAFIWFEKLFSGTDVPLNLHGEYTGWRMHASDTEGNDVWHIDVTGEYSQEIAPSVVSSSDRFVYINDFPIQMSGIYSYDATYYIRDASGHDEMFDTFDTGLWVWSGDQFNIYFTGTSGLLASYGISYDQQYVIPIGNISRPIELRAIYATGSGINSFGDPYPLYLYDSFYYSGFYNTYYPTYPNEDTSIFMSPQTYFRLSRPRTHGEIYNNYAAGFGFDVQSIESVGNSASVPQSVLESEWFPFNSNLDEILYTTGLLIASGIYGSGLF